ncbi:hypothetical protein FRC04_003305 [Tulasnella sp. 424]|nr:hypothetical protein FRC04_003305 [Tulasnella sp. 424]
MSELNSVSWGDVLVFFATVFGIFGVSGSLSRAVLAVSAVRSPTSLSFDILVGSWYIYNAIFGTLWQTKATLKDRGVEKGEDGVWRIKTNKTLSHETEVDKTQRGFVKAMQASSFSNSPKGGKGGKGKKAE